MLPNAAKASVKGSCKKTLSKKDPPKTLGTRVSCKTGAGLGGQRQDRHRARQA